MKNSKALVLTLISKGADINAKDISDKKRILGLCFKLI